MDQRMEAKRKFTSSNNQRDQDDFRKINNQVQSQIRNSKKEWEENQIREMESYFTNGDSKAYFEASKQTFGNKILESKDEKVLNNKGEICTIKSDIDEAWAGHGENLFSKSTNVLEEDNLRKFHEICAHHREFTLVALDDKPTKMELMEAIDKVKCGKASGADNLVIEMFKFIESPEMIETLYQLLVECWNLGRVPEDINLIVMTRLFKKGIRADMNNWRTISLVQVIEKIFEMFLDIRMGYATNEYNRNIIPESQYGFTAGRSTADPLFCLKRIQELCKAKDQTLIQFFVDLTKAYDTIPRELFEMVLSYLGMPPKLIKFRMALFDKQKACFRCNDGTNTRYFNMFQGLTQGGINSPLGFNCYFGIAIKEIQRRCKKMGIKFAIKINGNLFDTNFGSHTKAEFQKLMFDLLYADDAEFSVSNQKDAQELMIIMDEVFTIFGLTMSVIKTEIMVQRSSTDVEPLKVKLKDHTWEESITFKYVGCTMNNKNTNKDELDRRIQLGFAAYLKYKSKFESSLKMEAKIHLYVASILKAKEIIKEWKFSKRTKFL